MMEKQQEMMSPFVIANNGTSDPQFLIQKRLY